MGKHLGVDLHVFVYGTLKRGKANHHLIKAAQFIQEDEAPGKLYDCGPFPMAVEGEGWIKGELFKVTPHMLREMDRLEGHPNFYKRTDIRLRSNFPAEIYYYQGEVDNLRFLEDGRWK